MKRAPHFSVWSALAPALAPALNFGGVRMTALARKFHFFSISGQENYAVNCAGADFFEF